MNIRNLGLFGAAFLLLAVPGCGRKEDKKEAPAAGALVSGEVLVSIDGKPALTIEDFKKFVKEAAESDPQIQFMLQIMPDFEEQLFEHAKLREIVLGEWAVRNEITKKADYIKQKEQAEKALANMLNHKMFISEHVKEVSESDMHKYYQDHKDKDHSLLASPAGVKARAVVFDNEGAAKGFLTAVDKNHAAFDSKAKEIKKTVDNLGVVGQMSMLDPVVKEKISSLKTPTIVMIKARDKEFWVVLATGRSTAQYRPFEQVKEMIKETLMRERIDQAFKAKLSEYQEKYNIKINRAYFEKIKKDREEQRAKMMAQKKVEADSKSAKTSKKAA